MTSKNRTNYGYIKTRNNHTPSDYDINFNTEDIPPNIDYINADNLTRHLQSKTPITRKIHLQLTSNQLDTNNHVELHTTLNIYDNDKKIRVDFK